MDRWLNDSGGRMDGLSVRLSIQMYEKRYPGEWLESVQSLS